MWQSLNGYIKTSSGRNAGVGLLLYQQASRMAASEFVLQPGVTRGALPQRLSVLVQIVPSGLVRFYSIPAQILEDRIETLRSLLVPVIECKNQSLNSITAAGTHQIISYELRCYASKEG